MKQIPFTSNNEHSFCLKMYPVL